MTQEKLDLQRDVVLSERRERYENSPYGIARIIIPEAIYPEHHPYHHPTIGSAEDLKAATLDDVKGFFETYYVPGNASLVVAGDFDPYQVKQLIARTFGAVPEQPLPQHRHAEPVTLTHEVRRMAVDRVQFPRLYLVWHSPPAFAEGDIEIELLTTILADGPSSRLYQRLVIDEPLAREVDAFQYPKQLGSEARFIITATTGADLERIKRIILDEIKDIQEHGVSERELQRAVAATESELLQKMESLRRRADMLNEYRFYFGEANSFARHLTRYTSATIDDLKRWAGITFGEGRLDLRILPEGEAIAGANLDERPEDLAAGTYEPPLPVTLTLANGIPVHFFPRPGTGLVNGALLVAGGERLLPPEQAGLANLAAAMLNAGAAGKDTAAYADAVATLGASIEAIATSRHLAIELSGLSSRLLPTLDLFADMIIRPNLSPEDFEREKGLVLDDIRSRVERPQTVGFLAAHALLLGRDHPLGRPVSGYPDTVAPLTLPQLKSSLPALLNPSNAVIVMAGDVEPKELQAALDTRLGSWQGEQPAPPELPLLTTPPPPRLVLIDRPEAPQSVLFMVRPLTTPVDDSERSLRHSLETVLGGTFTSRLNQNIREEHGYSYGANCWMSEHGDQHLLWAAAAVQAEHTGAALGEFKNEFDAIATGDLSAEELTKALSTQRHRLVTAGSTTSAVAATLEGIVVDGRPLDAVHRALASIDQTTLEQVNEYAASSGIFAWDSLLVVIVGDSATVTPQLEAAGFGKTLLADTDGNLQ
jgi:predicted Zn-dependent peptidase